MLLFACCCAAPAIAQKLDTNFRFDVVVDGLFGPVSFDFGADGLIYITEKGGTIKTIKGGKIQAELFSDLSNITNSHQDRGLTSIELHPEFPDQPYVYVALTTDARSLDELETGLISGETAKAADAGGGRLGVVLRLTADKSTDFATAIRKETKVILGGVGFETVSDDKRSICDDGGSADDPDVLPIAGCMPNDLSKHTINTVRFANDGNLFVTVGDGGPVEKAGPLSARSQDLNSLAGKILRINPESGEGLRNNPFFNGDPNSNRARIYSYGLRNPFRIAFHPETHEAWTGDVGNWEWEEINTGRGKNFGWPCFEGGSGTNRANDNFYIEPVCRELEKKLEKITASTFAYRHNAMPASIILGDFAPKRGFSPEYADHLFFADFNVGTIRALNIPASGAVIRKKDVKIFASKIGGIVEMRFSDEGELFVLNVVTGTLARITAK